MATLQANFFALLNDEDSDDVSKLLERVASKAKAKDTCRPPTAEKEKQKQKKDQHSQKNIGGADNGRGRSGKGRGSTRINEVEQKVNGNGSRPIGQQGNNEPGQGGYNQGYRRLQNGNSDSCQWNYRGNWQGRGHGLHYPVGRGSGRGRGMGTDIGRVNQVPDVKGDHNQPGQEEGSGGSEGQWTDIQVHRNQRQFPNGYGNYGGERRQNGGGFRRSASGDDVSKRLEKKEDNGNKHTANGENGCAGSEGNVPASTELSKEDEERKFQQEKAAREREEKQRKKREEWEEEKKKMTLEQYEKILVEKRKALEALKKSEERKVTIDKELVLMKVVHKSKEDEDLLIMLNSEKDKPKKGNGDKEERGRKVVSINEFLKPDEDMQHGQFNRRGRRSSTVVEHVTPAIGDLGQFPVLGAAPVHE